MTTSTAHGRRRAAAGLLVLGALLTGCTPSTSTDPAAPPPSSEAPAPAPTGPAPTETPVPTSVPVAGTALAALDTLTVKGRAPKTGYSRDQFGEGWVDTDRNGCDSRNDVLARDLTTVTFKPGTRDCVVLTGTLADPYSGQPIAFTRGQDTSSDVQIDHVVALSDAWQKGAQQWDTARRTEFANDPLELLAVDGGLNQSKSDGDAATWLPPNRAYRCTYVARQVAVKTKYGLWVTAAEHDAIARVLSDCPTEPLPTDPLPTAAPLPVVAETSASVVTTDPVVTSGPVVPQPVAAPAEVTVEYANCTDVWNRTGAPVHRGDPGYATTLDRDGDGVGCENDPR